VGGFVLMREKFNVLEGRTDLGAPSLGNDPKRTATLRSLWNVTRAHEIDLAWHYVGALPSPAVPAYSILNARFGWRVARDLELSLSLNNALDRKHSQFGSPAERAVFGRNVYFKVTWAP
jgi:iron complex outermembrane receptor protein